MQASVGAHHLSRKLQARRRNTCAPYSKGEKNDYRDAEAIAEAVQRPTMVGTAFEEAADFNVEISKSGTFSRFHLRAAFSKQCLTIQNCARCN
jgi:transposase